MSYFQILKNASMFIGVFFCAVLLSCEEKKSTPRWQQKSIAEKKDTASEDKKVVTHQDYEAVRFLSYNLKNYLTMSRGYGDKESTSSKPLKDIEALVEIITSAQPDIFGICEIGTRQDLADLQKRLRKKGLDLSHSAMSQGSDSVRSLAILSRYPIAQTVQPDKLHYSIDGLTFQMSRGILDTTIQLPSREVRFLGVHLKSKRASQIADQSLMRFNECMLLRQHADAILTDQPGTQLIVYGDFNDTKRSRTLDTLRGRSNSPLSLSAIELKDSRDESWTHYWSHEDIYSRFDYVMASPAAKPHIDRKQSLILDPKNWKTASDHRPLLVIIK